MKETEKMGLRLNHKKYIHFSRAIEMFNYRFMGTSMKNLTTVEPGSNHIKDNKEEPEKQNRLNLANRCLYD